MSTNEHRRGTYSATVTTLGGRTITLTLEAATPDEVEERVIGLVPDHQIVASVDVEPGYSQRHNHHEANGDTHE